MKPCYLFALVAGDLAVHRDSFTTMSGRKVWHPSAMHALQHDLLPQHTPAHVTHANSMPPALALTKQLAVRAQVDLALYVQDRNIGKVHWAMRSLKEAMKCALAVCMLSAFIACLLPLYVSRTRAAHRPA